MGPPPELMAYTIHEAAQMVRVSDRTIRRAITSGRLRAVHIGRTVRVPRESLNALLSPVSPPDDEAREAAMITGHTANGVRNKEKGKTPSLAPYRARAGESCNESEHKENKNADHKSQFLAQH
jgi:excisionase family DNA binding protein